MWWQVLPTMGIIAGLMTIPHIFNPVIHMLVYGRPTNRCQTSDEIFSYYSANHWRRDRDRYGDPEAPFTGLSEVPDD